MDTSVPDFERAVKLWNAVMVKELEFDDLTIWEKDEIIQMLEYVVNKL